LRITGQETLATPKQMEQLSALSAEPARFTKEQLQIAFTNEKPSKFTKNELQIDGVICKAPDAEEETLSFDGSDEFQNVVGIITKQHQRLELGVTKDQLKNVFTDKICKGWIDVVICKGASAGQDVEITTNTALPDFRFRNVVGIITKGLTQ